MLRYIVIGLLFLLPGLLTAQSNKQRQPGLDQRLETARELSETDPEKAIDMVDGILRRLRRKKDPHLEGTAFLVLGEIYANINQHEQAISRYRQGLLIANAIQDSNLIAQINYKKGESEIVRQQFDAARVSYESCINYAVDKQIELVCNEGLADIAIGRADYNQSLEYLDLLQNSNTYELDSLSNSRIEARRSKVYAYQQKIPEAQQSYEYALNSLPKEKLSKKDVSQIQSANVILFENANSSQEKEALQINRLSPEKLAYLPSGIILEEQLALASNSIDRNELVKASDFLKTSKPYLPKVEPELQARYYQLSSELELKEGDLDAAKSEYEAYFKANEKVWVERQQELDQQLAVLQKQKDIDLLIKDFALEEKDRQFLESQIRNQQLIIGLLMLLLIATLVGFYFIMKNVRARRQANQLLLLKSLRTQMNPHFIFNALNSVNNFIAQNDERAANQYLSDFSRLMRMVLDYSNKDFITFAEEVELLGLYLKLEHLRFRDKFSYSFEKDEALERNATEIPPMLIQPFIENAIWHGLRYKKLAGKLLVRLQINTDHIAVLIEDNGIGRTRSASLKTANQFTKKSTGLRNVQKRLELVNKVYDKAYSLQISDLNPEQEDCGTKVQLLIPLES